MYGYYDNGKGESLNNKQYYNPNTFLTLKFVGIQIKFGFLLFY